MPLNPLVANYLAQTPQSEQAPQNTLLAAQKKVSDAAAAKWQASLDAGYKVKQGTTTWLPGMPGGAYMPRGNFGGGFDDSSPAARWYRDAGKPWPSGGGGGAGQPYIKGGGDLIGRIMQTIGTKESGNDYNARNPNPGATARGRYQFVSGTWAGLNKRYGGNVNDWSPQHQDFIARSYIGTILAANHNDVLSVAPTWYVGHYDPNNLDYIPRGGNTMTIRAYRDAWMKYFNQT